MTARHVATSVSSISTLKRVEYVVDRELEVNEEM